MATRRFYLGSRGPFLFDDTKQFQDGTTHGLRTTKSPSEPDDVLRLGDVGGGGPVAPVDAQYLVLAFDSDLTTERRLVAGTGLSINDGGANGDATINHDPHAAETDLTDSTLGTTDGTVQALTDPSDAPADADTLRDDLVANLIPELRNNLAELTEKTNAILALLRDQNILGT